MKAVLHVGPHKTGSTSLQLFLDANRKKLYADGIYVPSIRSPDNTPNNWYLIYVFSRSDERTSSQYHNAVRASSSPAYCNQLRRSYQQQLDQEILRASLEAPAINSLVFSTEEIVFLEKDEVNKLYRHLLGSCSEINVVYYYRSPIDRLRSDIQQAAKAGTVISANTFLNLPCQDTLRIERLEPDADLAKRVTVHVRAYQRHPARRIKWDIRKDFCDIIGSDFECLEKPLNDKTINANMSLQMFSILQGVNRAMPLLKPDKTYNMLRRHLHDAVEHYRWTPDDTPFMLSQDDIAGLCRSHHASSRFIAYTNSSPWIKVQPECHDVHKSIGTEPYQKGVRGSIFDYQPEISHAYYVNAICHFWSFLRTLDIEATAKAKRSAQPR